MAETTLTKVFSQVHPAEVLEPFEGEQTYKNIPHLIKRYETQQIDELQRAKKEGYDKALLELRAKVKERINQYLFFLTQVTDAVYTKADEKFKECDFKISKIRTNFYFDTQRINLLFIIDADYKYEKDFHKSLLEIEQFVLKTKNSVVELLYLNNRSKTLDTISISCDFPIIIKKANPIKQ
jgi:hypothetical protein